MKKLSFLAAAVCLFLTGCGGFQPITAEDSPAAARQQTVLVPEISDKRRTTDVSFYGMMLDGMQHCELSVTYPDVIAEDEVRSTFIKLCADHPEIFWISSIRSETTDSETTVYFTFLDGYTPEELRLMYAQTVQASEEIAALVRDSDDDYDIALTVHDFLINNTAPVNGSSTFDISATAYGCLVKHSATGRGYAQAFLLMMHKMGIEAGMCEGFADKLVHTWNYVRLNDEYYWLDAAWDDPRSTDTPIIRHAYCFMPDSLFLTNRTLAESNYAVQKCEGTACNYFVKNNLYFTEYQFAELKPIIAEQVKNGYAEIMFADAQSAEAAVQDLVTEKHIWKIPGVDNKTMNVSYMLTADTHALYLSFSPKTE